MEYPFTIGGRSKLVVWDMGKFDEILSLVRRCSVSLFIGSGFSLKAGGPSSDLLKKAIAHEFPKGYKRGLSGMPLDDVAQEFVRYHRNDRSALLRVLEKQFSFRKKDLSDHQALARIPHFSRIFTTNYDTLLEDTYGERINVVRCSEDCVNDLKEVNLYKIHGDLTCPDQLVITRNDYDDLLSTEKNRAVWNKVFDAFVSTDVLFIGYSLDDTNVQRVLKAVSDAVGAKRRRVFLIAPNLSAVKIDELSRWDVVCFDAYAEEFLSELTSTLKNTIYKDLAEGTVPVEIASRFLNLYEISAEIEYSGGKAVVKRLRPSDPSVPQTIHITVPAGDDPRYSPFEYGLNDAGGFLKGPCVAFTQDTVRSFEHRINGVRVMGTDELGRLEVGPPAQEGTIDVMVEDIGFMEKVPYRKYQLDNKVVISLDTPLCVLEISYAIEDGKRVNYLLRTEYKDDYGSYMMAKVWTKSLEALFGGSEMRIGHMLSLRINPSQFEGLVSLLRKSNQYYEDVHQIELLRKESFLKHSKYEEDNAEVAMMVRYMLSNGSFEEKLYRDGRIEVELDKDIEDSSFLNEMFYSDDIRMTQTTDEDVVLNGVNFGRITMSKALPKAHIERHYEKDGKSFISIAPDSDYWIVTYIAADESIQRDNA